MVKTGETVAYRNSGISIVGAIPWGTHLCQFYESKQDLIDILVPYFTEGLKSHEFCIWVTSPPLEVEEAKEALTKAVPNLDEYFRKGQIEIVSYKNGYLLGGKFDADRILQGWVEKESNALNHGFEGLRVTGNTFWIERNLWQNFADYEETINAIVCEHKMIALCTYCLKKCSGTDALDVVRNHMGTLLKQGEKWSLVEDILQRKKTEQALQESQIDLNRAQEVAKTGSWRLDVQRNVLLWSDVTYRMFGVELGTPLTYETFLSAIHPDDRKYVDKKWQAALRGEPYDIEHRIVVNGEIKWVRERAELEFNSEGVLLGGFGTVQDITARKELEKELVDSLEASQRRQLEVSALLKASKAVLQHHEFKKAARLIFDSCKELLGANAGYVALLSKKGEENEVLFLDAGGLPCSVDPSLPMPIRGLRAEAYNKDKVVYCNSFLRSKWAKLMPNGHVALKNVLFAPLVIDKKTVGVMGLANKPSGFDEHDANMALAFGEIASVALMNSRVLETLEELVEERTKALKNSERLAAIGETAGMVGHDLRNPLQTISGETYLAKKELAQLPGSEAKSSLEESIQIIDDQINYMDKIVSDLQNFVRPITPDKAPVNLQKLLNVTLAEVTLPENVEVYTQINQDLPEITADAQLLKRVFINLATNAVQAMPEGGVLTVKTQKQKTSKGKEKILINFEDTGVGIPEEIKTKIFKPLFTTKSRGQGFGLAVCKRVIEAHGGTIKFKSQEGKGAQFTVELPMRQQ